MYFYKIIVGEYIDGLMKAENNISSDIFVPISETEYNNIINLSKDKPEDTLEAIYRLSNETETYVPCERTHEETVDWYVEKVSGGEMTIEEVPEEYRAEVESKLPTPTEPTYTLDEAATILAQEVSA